jgi:hypothetical protein
MKFIESLNLPTTLPEIPGILAALSGVAALLAVAG